MSYMIFYFNPMSRTRVAHWMLEEVGAKYDLKLIDWKTNQEKSPEIKRCTDRPSNQRANELAQKLLDP